MCWSKQQICHRTGNVMLLRNRAIDCAEFHRSSVGPDFICSPQPLILPWKWFQHYAKIAFAFSFHTRTIYDALQMREGSSRNDLKVLSLDLDFFFRSKTWLFARCTCSPQCLCSGCLLTGSVDRNANERSLLGTIVIMQWINKSRMKSVS